MITRIENSHIYTAYTSSLKFRLIYNININDAYLEFPLDGLLFDLEKTRNYHMNDKWGHSFIEVFTRVQFDKPKEAIEIIAKIINKPNFITNRYHLHKNSAYPNIDCAIEEFRKEIPMLLFELNELK